MSSILGLPKRGSDVTILITRVHLHPLCVLVEFWGKFSQDRTADYECLFKDIQSSGNTFQASEGNPGDQCLVQIDGTWHRSRIVSRNVSKYSVFLIDKGITHNTTTSKLAWGKEEHYQLPPEVEFCVLANVLPLSAENRWSQVGLEYLKSLSGKSVEAHVQDVLVPHRTFILHIPCISKQMYEMGFAKKVSPSMFQNYVLMSLQSHSGAEVSPEIKQLSVGTGEQLHKKELFMYPELPGGTVEAVIVTEVTNPQRIFCQLKVFSKELKKLSEQLTQSCEGRKSSCFISPEMIGFPCAARGSDGKWYRSVLQQVFPTNKVVEVLNVDYGTKQFVQEENVRPLAAEFFRMPVVTYICSLHGVIDKGVGWTISQIDYLRSLFLYKTVIAKFEYQSISEGVHYVTLYGDDNTNMNNLFGSKESCLLECEKTFRDYAIRNTAHRQPHSDQQEIKTLTPGQAVEQKERKAVAEKLPAEDLSLNSSHVAVVQHASNPSEFWIQTQDNTKELNDLMDSIYHLYKDSVSKDVVRNPTVGLYCAAKAEDGDFYRATVAEVGETHIKVFFVDYGNTEMVDRSNIRTLPAELKKLPRLALKCTLAGVKPKDGRWSHSASEFFIKAVTDKVLNVHVTAKCDDNYAVKLTDVEAEGEQDISTLMCSSGFAEVQRHPKDKVTVQAAVMSSTQHSNARLTGRNSGMSFETQDTVGLSSNQRRVPTFKEHMFPTGSVLDVSVSYIESPNDFWCQLVHNAGHLKLLMHDIQAHYAGSEFQPCVETACIARHPDNGMWYRALVIHKRETPHVDVLFVDYGQTETVSLYDLRRICPEFLTLQGQAFRCSLLNPIDPTSAVNEWTEEAIARFQNFVETAASNFVILKCTIYAVMYSEQKIVFNIVDLETPFESICTSMVNLVKSAPLKKAAGPSFRLDTYYYSTHNIKTGTEEQVTVTCVNNVSQFYCQLEKNADGMKDLKIKVSNLCHQLENVKLPTVFGTLCFARYTDGQWYRGQIKSIKPTVLVHFVDYGDTIEVDKSDLLPVPREANDIMAVPVQAVVCGLSDVPANVPSEVNSWFETAVTECKFRVLVVAREPDGKLMVELYHKKTQINAKLKKMFQLEVPTEEQVVHRGQRALEASANYAQKMPKQTPDMEYHTQVSKKNNFSASKPQCHMKDEWKSTDMNLQSPPMSTRHVFENGRKAKTAPLELYKPPRQRQLSGRMAGRGPEPAGVHMQPKKENLPTDTKQLIKSKSPGTESKKEGNAEKLPKLADLPSTSVTCGMAADVYVSHCNSPLDFYVQCVNEEEKIFSLVEKLNDPKSTPKTKDIEDVHPGDLVQAEFTDDSSWYRAVVQEIHGNAMALVEFIDFGNRAMTPISKIGRLHKSFLQSPMYSTHCMLRDAAVLGKEGTLDPEVVSAFKDEIGGGEKVLKCQFIRQVGSMWEVSLEDNGVGVVCKVPPRCPEITSEKLEQVQKERPRICDIRQLLENSEKSVLSPCSLRYHQQEFLEGQQLEVYITTINDAQTFWCQSADSDELDKIALSVSEVGNAADLKHINPGMLYAGSPCIALFSDDQLWYRAEVIDKNGDELSVLFVDYGNKSQVSVADVREMPPQLLEIPQQAFLFELEGFDSLCGSFDSGAVDELSSLIMDKLLQLTVTKVTGTEGKIKGLVQIECEGQVVNEVMKTWWKCFTTEDKSDAVGLTSSYKAPLQLDSAVKDQLEQPDIHEGDNAFTCIHPEKEYNADKLADADTRDEIPQLSSTPKNSGFSEDSVHTDSYVESPKKENVSIEEVNIIHDMGISPKDILLCNSGIETMVPPPENKDGQDVVTSSCFKNVVETDKGIEKSDLVENSVRPDDSNSSLEKTLVEAMVELVTATTDKESPPGEEYPSTCRFDFTNAPDPAKERGNREAVVQRGFALTCVTAVKVVPHKAVPRDSTDLHETTHTIFELSKQTEAELVLPSLGLPVEHLCGCCVDCGNEAVQWRGSRHWNASTEQEIEAGDGIVQEEVPFVTIQVENDSISEEEASAHPENTHSALLADTDTAPSEPHTVPAPETGDMLGEVMCCVEETRSTDVCTVAQEPSDEVISAREDSLSSVTAEETVLCITVPQGDVGPQAIAEESNEVQNVSLGTPSGNTEDNVALQDEVPCTSIPHEGILMTEDETLALHENKRSALPSETEPQACTVPSPDLSQLVEELTCLVGEICLADVCQGLPEAATDDSDQQVHTPPQQDKDLDNSVISEECSSAEDSFEAQLSKISHLSLIISRGFTDILPAEQQPEE